MSGTIATNPNRQSGTIGGVPSATNDSSDPVRTTNPSSGVGSEWHNTTSGQIFICTNATTDQNVWQGQRGTKIYGARGVTFAGNLDGSLSRKKQYITIPTTGDAADFGDCSANYDVSNNQACGNGSNDRLVTGGGHQGSSVYIKLMEYVNATVPGNSSDFGDLTTVLQNCTSTSNGTDDRGFFAGGYAGGAGDVADIKYITISSKSHASLFGDVGSNDCWDGGCSTSGATTNDRAIIMGGGRSGARNTVQYYKMSAYGNSTGFGTLSTTRYATSACSNEVRAICSGGYQYPNGDAGAGYCTLSCDYFTIATTGNASVFGNLTGTVRYNGGGCDSGAYGDRGVFCGGYNPGVSNTDTIDYCTISTTADFTDFGDLVYESGEVGMASNGFS